jgi:hypothetical protein
MEGAKMAKWFYLYSRKRKGKPTAWYARFRSDDGTIGSPVCTRETDESKAEQWAIETLLKGDFDDAISAVDFGDLIAGKAPAS